MLFNGRENEELELSPEKKIVVLVVFLFINLLLISSQVILKNRQSLLVHLLAEAVSPFQKAAQNTISYVDSKIDRYLFLGDIYQRYQSLQKKYRRLLADYYHLKGELWPGRLRQRFTAPGYLQAAVIYVDRNFPLEFVTINRGKKDGVKADMVVVNQEMEVVGKIVDPVSVSSSRVMLLTSSKSAVGAFIENERIEGLLQGTGGRSCDFQYIIEDRQVQEGVEIITSGSDAIFPPYLPVGKIRKVARGSYLTLQISVEPYFLNKSFKYLYIMRGKGR